MSLTLGQLLELTGGTLVSPAELSASYTGCATLAAAASAQISFLGNPRYIGEARNTKAGVVFVTAGHDEPLGEAALIATSNPSVAFGKALQHFAPPAPILVPGIHPTACVDATAALDATKVSVGPHAVIEAGASVGDGTQISAGCFVGSQVKIGQNCWLAPRSVVMADCILGDRVRLQPGVVIGGDGYGYEFVQGRHQKIDQIGNVEIGNDVEIGANSTIDRARFGSTVIGEGTKIDNQVQIAHGAILGKHCIVVAQVGIAGSAEIGDYTVIAAQAGVAGHISIAAKSVIAARTGVTKTISEAGQYMGFPATTAREAREQMVLMRRLPELLARVRQIEAQLPPQASS